MAESEAVAGEPIGAAVWRRAGRIVLTGFIAAVGGGLLTGVPARVLMRLVRLAAGGTPQFSWSGSIGVLVFFAGAMLPGALLAAAWTGRWRWLGLAAGAVLLCIPAGGIASTEVDNTSGFSGGTWLEVGLAGLGVFACIAALPIVTLRLIDLRRR